MRELQPKTSQNHQDRNEKWVKNKDQKLAKHYFDELGCF